MTELVVLDGLSPYAAVHALQERLVELRRAGRVGDVVLLLQHPPTITVGRRAEGLAGVVAPGDVPVVAIERGGEATYHAPGQLVAYPIVALDGPRRDVHAHLRALEEAVITVLAGLGIAGGRDARNTGVWVAGRKICSVGIAIRQWVTWHGLALNVDVDLGGFARIRPCGFDAEVMTRLADHVRSCPPASSLVEALGASLVDALGLAPDPRVTRTVVATEADVARLLADLAVESARA